LHLHRGPSQGQSPRSPLPPAERLESSREGRLRLRHSEGKPRAQRSVALLRVRGGPYQVDEPEGTVRMDPTMQCGRRAALKGDARPPGDDHPARCGCSPGINRSCRRSPTAAVAQRARSCGRVARGLPSRGAGLPALRVAGVGEGGGARLDSSEASLTPCRVTWGLFAATRTSKLEVAPAPPPQTCLR
jgi:hypothetical protein